MILRYLDRFVSFSISYWPFSRLNFVYLFDVFLLERVKQQNQQSLSTTIMLNDRKISKP